jgi:hypothetical protein
MMGDYPKYIIAVIEGREVAFVFSHLIQHSSMKGHGEIVAAGFCYTEEDGFWYAQGKSVSLGIGSRPQDGRIIDKTYCDWELVEERDTKERLHGKG